jgi:hypothetical protein
LGTGGWGESGGVPPVALEAKRPKARYPITPSAHLMINQRRVTPDRVWDLIMRCQFPTPKR